MFKLERRCWVSRAMVLGLAGVCGSAEVAFAEDIQITNPAGSRAPRVRTAARPSPVPVARPVTRPAAAVPATTVPARPRPIQDETTAAAPVAPMRTVPAVKAIPSRSQEQAVDLGAMVSPSASTSTTPAATSSGRSTSTGSLSPHGTSSVIPNFKFYFDFLIKSWKGNTAEAPFSFDSYHQRMLVEYTPTPELMFQADISAWQSPKYFEVDYNLTPTLQLRWGRIWIPFDDMSPHSIFGGRLNTSEFFQGSEGAFLPDIWADMGMGIKITIADSAKFSSDFHFYAVNGFQSGGTSPVAGEAGLVEYPNFAGTTLAQGDNNNDKSLGARWHSVFGRKFGIGGSVFRGAYTAKSAAAQKGIFMVGGDIQLMPSATTQIRVGIVSMKVDVNPPATKSSFSRGGSYVELGQKFGFENRWKFLIRAGKSQNDNRVVDVSDKTLVGATLLKNFGSIEAQLTYYRDMNTVASKIANNYGAFRLVTAF